MTNSILAVSVAAAAIVGSFTLPTIEPNYGQEWQPCEHEDSLGCYWDSSTRGNGQGTSFVALESGELIYLP